MRHGILNPNRLKVITVIVEPSLANTVAGQNFQFERHGYFVADRVDQVQGSKAMSTFEVVLGTTKGSNEKN